MKNFLLFSAGFVAGATFITYELLTEQLIVNNHLDGSVTLHHPGMFKKRKPVD